MISNPLAVSLILALIVFLAVSLERNSKFFRSLGGALIGILLAMTLSNTGVLPAESAAYDFLMGTGVSLGIALILLSVDVRSVLQAGPRMLAAFGLGAAGTALGTVVAALLLSGLVGPETWKLAGQYAGTYTGGGVNFAAVGQAVGTSSTLFTAGIAADVIVTAIWLATCLAVPVILGRKRASSETVANLYEAPEGLEETPTLERALYNSGRPVALTDMAALVTIAVGTVWLSGALGDLIPLIPRVLWLTTLVLILAQIPAIKALPGGAMLGNYLVLLFLASNGAKSVIANIFVVGPAVFYFAIVTVALHGLFLFGVGRLFKIDLPTLVVASQANIGGPASAMAMASARGYLDRLLPGVAVGLLGYALGNYLGLAIAALVQGMLGV